VAPPASASPPAKRFAAEGARVIVTGRNRETLEAARTELGDRAEVIESDAGDEKQIAQLFEGLAKTHRQLDVLFLNAGIAKFAPLAEASVKDFDAMWTLNVRGPWLALKHALPLLSEGANVIVNTSVVNQKGLAGAAAYAATKAALRAVVRGAANELAARKIRVNAISPGPIETPIFGKLGLSKNAADDFLKDAATRIPLGRIGAADEVAGAALFLASADASFITGSEIAVDGGFAQV
jgi:NAD(P)-dependent dehydrogenase (short-subunit alcohol dehydrogenase family)